MSYHSNNNNKTEHPEFLLAGWGLGVGRWGDVGECAEKHGLPTQEQRAGDLFSPAKSSLTESLPVKGLIPKLQWLNTSHVLSDSQTEDLI